MLTLQIPRFADVLLLTTGLFVVELTELGLMLTVTRVEVGRKLLLQFLDLVKVRLLLLEGQVVELLFHSFLLLVLIGELLVMILIHLLHRLQMLIFSLVHLSLQVLVLSLKGLDVSD